ncbi:nucleotidyltransferase family protein [Alteromonas antoniana]|uniref:nucleotidyltransferase family protein n=1 Tax=Alteromonas antoniana TaxID=2803813 RepID=UPI001C4429C7
MRNDVLETLILALTGNKPTNFDELHWRDVIRVARSADVVHRLSHTVLNSDFVDKLSDKVKATCFSYNRHTQLFHNQVKYEYTKLQKDTQGIEFGHLTFLKGAAYVISDSQAANGRIFSDIDILVDKPSLSVVERRLNLVGWVSMKGTDYDQNYYRKWSHEIPPLMHVQRKTVLDVHHNIIPPVSGKTPNMETLISSKVMKEGNFSVLSPAGMVLHSAVHLFFKEEFVFGFRDLSDIYLLVTENQHDDEFWRELKALSTKLGFEREVYLALHFLTLIMGWVPVKESKVLFNSSGTGYLSSKICDWMFLRILRPKHKSVRLRGTEIAYFLGFVRGHMKKMSLGVLAYHVMYKGFSSFKYLITGQKKRADLLEK